MEQYITSGSGIKAGYVYKCIYNITGQAAYMVCIGKIITRLPTWQFVTFLDLIPENATLETHPLSGLITKSVELQAKSINPTEHLVCLGKVIEPTEIAIKGWLTQLKLAGYTIYREFNRDLILGDWRNRERIPYVKRFRIEQFYVKEELAYLRTKIPYQINDIIWRYLGKRGKYYVWQCKTIGDYKWGKEQELEWQLREMVAYKPNDEWYQER
jgi:hypothetical protein